MFIVLQLSKDSLRTADSDLVQTTFASTHIVGDRKGLRSVRVFIATVHSHDVKLCRIVLISTIFYINNDEEHEKCYLESDRGEKEVISLSSFRAVLTEYI